MSIESVIESLEKVCPACLASTSQETWDQLHRGKKCPTLVERAVQRIAMCAVTPGHVWRHTKTKSHYEIVCLSIDEVRLVVLVTYRSLTKDLTWTRDLDVFLGPNEFGNQRFERVDLDPGETHYAGNRCKRCGSADLEPHGMGSEIFRWSCRTCGADPA